MACLVLTASARPPSPSSPPASSGHLSLAHLRPPPADPSNGTDGDIRGQQGTVVVKLGKAARPRPWRSKWQTGRAAASVSRLMIILEMTGSFFSRVLRYVGCFWFCLRNATSNSPPERGRNRAQTSQVLGSIVQPLRHSTCIASELPCSSSLPLEDKHPRGRVVD